MRFWLRQLIPYVGNSVETISIVIAAVLAPMAFGYFYAGSFDIKNSNLPNIIRNKSCNNVIYACFFLLAGLSYFSMTLFFIVLEKFVTTNYLLQTMCYSAVSLVYPVFLLAQTIPLINHYLRKAPNNLASGTTLFFSTLGSSLGSIFTTLILMTILGVHMTVVALIITLMLMLTLIMKKTPVNFAKVVLIISAVGFINSPGALSIFNMIEATPYSTIRIFKDGAKSILSINHTISSTLDKQTGRKAHYVNRIEYQFLNPATTHGKRSVLVIGAEVFSLGFHDTVNHYTYVDIDQRLKQIVEQHYLKHKLNKHIKFIAKPARAYLSHTKEKFDIIILDYYRDLSIPSQLVTIEFFQDVKLHLKDQGIVIFNATTSPNFKDQCSIRLDKTFRKVFPSSNREVIEKFSAWGDSQDSNVLYSYYHRTALHGVYEDNKNRSFFDKSLKS